MPLAPSTPVAIYGAPTIVMLPVSGFGVGSAGLPVGAKEDLDEVVKSLRDRKMVVEEVRGHASPGEPDPKGLGLRRARAVMQALRDAGLAVGEDVISSAGDSEPLNDGQTEEDNAKNRRVSFRIGPAN